MGEDDERIDDAVEANMVPRQFRVQLTRWEKAQRVAARRGDNLSEVLRRFVDDYAESDDDEVVEKVVVAEDGSVSDVVRRVTLVLHADNSVTWEGMEDD